MISTTTPTTKTSAAMPGLRRYIFRNFRLGVAAVILITLLTITTSLNPKFLTPASITSTSNQSMTLVFAGMAQTSVVITGGIDLSVGPMISLSNSLASAAFTEPDDGLNIVMVVLIVLAVASLADSSTA